MGERTVNPAGIAGIRRNGPRSRATVRWETFGTYEDGGDPSRYGRADLINLTG